MTASGIRGPVLVTGAGGFIGRRLVERLALAGLAVIGWTREDVDLSDSAAVGAAMAALQPTTIFHLAAAGVSAARANDTYVIADNMSMAVAVVEAAPPGTRLVMTGTMAEYGRSGRHRETDEPEPRTNYAKGKLAAGMLATAMAEEKGMPATVARLFGVYGPGEAPARLFPSLIGALSAGRPIALSAGEQRRDFIHVDDVCDALVAIAAVDDGTCPAIVNVGTGHAVRVRDAIEWVCDALGAPRGLLHFGARERSPGDEDLLEADVQRLTALLGAPPPQRLEPGLSLDLFGCG
jgi:nucleoside-diphosphate-sugar epimerase